jgi:hypothetical protein
VVLFISCLEEVFSETGLPVLCILGKPYSVLWIASLGRLLHPPGEDEKPDAPRKHKG